MSKPQQSWSSGQFACCDDISICLFGCFCPCVQYGRNVRQMVRLAAAARVFDRVFVAARACEQCKRRRSLRAAALTSRRTPTL
jgi:Cys-rich protein (TIGR01571 family)